MSIGKFKKEELRSIVKELKLVVPYNAKVLDLRELIRESEIYKNDKETYQNIVDCVLEKINDRRNENENRLEIEKIKFSQLEKELEIAKLHNQSEHVTLVEESSDSDRSKDEEETVSDDTTYEPSCSSEPHLLTQEDLNDLIRDLKLSKKQSEMLGSRLKGWNLLQANRKICTYRKHHSQRKDYFCEKMA
ncbi:hypothetical protein TNCV_5111741 [Trichonephila clavipes]|nr:hypothetical protein TNCV_5111741 [Trichonephila clavipes]